MHAHVRRHRIGIPPAVTAPGAIPPAAMSWRDMAHSWLRDETAMLNLVVIATILTLPLLVYLVPDYDPDAPLKPKRAAAGRALAETWTPRGASLSGGAAHAHGPAQLVPTLVCAALCAWIVCEVLGLPYMRLLFARFVEHAGAWLTETSPEMKTIVLLTIGLALLLPILLSIPDRLPEETWLIGDHAQQRQRHQSHRDREPGRSRRSPPRISPRVAHVRAGPRDPHYV